MALAAEAGGVMDFSASAFERAVEDLREICGRLPWQIQKLIARLDGIKPLLKDAEKQQTSSHKARLWFEEAKQIFLDAEDLVDEMATDSAVRSMGAPAGSSNPSVGDQILEINHRLDHLDFYTPMIGLSETSNVVEDGRVGSLHWRQTGSLLPYDASVIGRDREKDHIIEMLLSPSPVTSRDICFSILPIVGMGGMGKTTLAQLVFNDRLVKKHFADLMMWVCVSNNFDPKVLTGGMIEVALAYQGKYGQYEMTDWDSMQQKLRHEVERKTFLMVLDDVWEGELSMWEKLLKPLQSGSKGSKILVTSRDKVFVLKMQGFIHPPVEVQRLSDADTWSLFERFAFYGIDSTSAEYSELEATGRNIADRLRGSPLAARTIGSLLNIELDVQYWKTVLESELWMLEQEQDGILPALQLSYRFLREDLKQCFAYYSLFPKDFAFRKEQVVQMWEAQSFTEKAGDKHFDELLHRFFFEQSNQYKKMYAMHDMMHDLAEYVSRDDCSRVEDVKATKTPSTVRHIYVQDRTEFDPADLINVLSSCKKLRTLLFSHSLAPKFQLSRHVLVSLFPKLKTIRVLGLRDCQISGELPASVGDLKHLRYMDLSRNHFLQKLPESLGNLHNLQVLKLDDCLRLREWPATMSQLVNLRHLTQPNLELEVSDIDGLGKMTALQELKVTGRKVRELGSMRMLRSLTIYKVAEVMSKEDAIEARLHTMEQLQALRLEWSGTNNRKPKLEEEVLQSLRPSAGIEEIYIDGSGGTKLPDWMRAPMVLASFSSLRRVSIRNCLSLQGMLSSLTQLPHLKVLDIKGISEWPSTSCGDRRSDPHQDPCSAELFFPVLRQLQIEDCPGMKALPILPPTLRRLYLDSVGLLCLPPFSGQNQSGSGIDEVTVASSPPYSPPGSASFSALRIYDCDNLTSIGEMLEHRLPNLVNIDIDFCKSLVRIPENGFGHMISLKRLRFACCPLLRPPEAEGKQHVVCALSQHLPCSLEVLTIENCGDTMGGWWWAGLERLTSITFLTLEGCPTTVELLFDALLRLAGQSSGKLSLPLKSLQLSKCGCAYYYGKEHRRSSSTPLSSASSSPSPLGPLTSLKSLTVRRSPNLLRKWGIGGLPPCLRDLTVEDDDSVDHELLSECFRGLISLEHLELVNLKNLSRLPDNLNALSSLVSLKLWGCPCIQSLPTGALPSSLENSTIGGFPEPTDTDANLPRSTWSRVPHVPQILMRRRFLIWLLISCPFVSYSESMPLLSSLTFCLLFGAAVELWLRLRQHLRSRRRAVNITYLPLFPSDG